MNQMAGYDSDSDCLNDRSAGSPNIGTANHPQIFMSTKPSRTTDPMMIPNAMATTPKTIERASNNFCISSSILSDFTARPGVIPGRAEHAKRRKCRL